MGRPRRLSISNTTYHITSRGDNRETLFRDDTDYQRYLQLLKAYKTKWRYLLFSYALMPNHVHLLLRPTTAEGTVSHILHDVQARYARFFNRRYERTGHVFQGRFHASIIKRDSYLLAASRYIHLNPVRAGLCRTASAYPWTSMRAYIEPDGDPLRLVDTHLILTMAAAEPTLQRQAYQALVETDWCQAPKYGNFDKVS